MMINQHIIRLCLAVTLFTSVVCPPSAHAQDKEKKPTVLQRRVAGQTVRYWLDRYGRGTPMDRVQAAAVLTTVEGTCPCQMMMHASRDVDPAVRHWGAIGLVKIPERYRKHAVARLTDMLEDPSPIVRVTAAQSLCRLNQPEAAVASLVKTLSDGDDATRVRAAVALGRIGEHARPAIPALRAALKDKYRYVVRNAEHALNNLGIKDP